MESVQSNYVSARLILLVAFAMWSSGCAHGVVSQRAKLATNAIPAHRLPDVLAAPSKKNRVPIDFNLLRTPPVDEHIIGPEDILGVYVETVFEVATKQPAVFYPPNEGVTGVRSPSVGHPMTVELDGTVVMPLVGPIDVAGATLPEARRKIEQAYRSAEIIKDQQQVTVQLIRPRTITVHVFREDTGPSVPVKARRDEQVIARRGSGHMLELPVYRNDVLNALTMTGGLPGLDGENEVWVLRGGNVLPAADYVLESPSDNVTIPHALLEVPSANKTRIPLRVCPGQALPFGPADVVLQEGDIVFVQAREEDYFMTGGLIAGGKFPLPRDHDVDIVEAMAIANANVGGPAGGVSPSNNFRSGPGNIVAPSRAIIVRQLDSGEQIKIEVDLRSVGNNPQQRINIMSRDLIVLQYRPSELAANIGLNLINFNFAIPSSTTTFIR